MSDFLKLVDSLEVRLNVIVKRLEEKERLNNELLLKIAQKDEKIHQQELVLNNYKEKYEALKLASSMLGNEDYKRETKLKINTLIREIDHCIVQLSK
jgi:hypothetical protein